MAITVRFTVKIPERTNSPSFERSSNSFPVRKTARPAQKRPSRPHSHGIVSGTRISRR